MHKSSAPAPGYREKQLTWVHLRNWG